MTSGSPTWPAGIPKPTDPRLSPTVARLVDASGEDLAESLAGAVSAVARARGLEVEFRVEDQVVEPDWAVSSVEIDPDLAREQGHFLPGAVREVLTGPSVRRSSGVHHTPIELASALVAMALGDRSTDVVGDPSVGGGVFLLAAAEQLAGEPNEILGRLTGCDIDPLAVATTEAALALWSGGIEPPRGAIRVADFMAGDPFGGVRPDAVVGNPPFLSQLRGSTVRGRARRSDLRGRWPQLGGYVDESVAFLLAAVDESADGGTVALIQPTSFLSARDAQSVRRHLEAVAPPTAFWWSREPVFDADVDVCAIVCRPGSTETSVRRFEGLPAVDAGSCLRPSPESWSTLLSGMSGVPDVAVDGESLSSIANVTAGFRDQYYGLRGAIVEDPEGDHPLVTSGLIDPLRFRRGSTTCRFDRQTWQSPAVVIDRVDPAIRGWVNDRLRPKVMVATQTRVVEVMVDDLGVAVPCTPVVVVEPHDPAMVWHVAAALTSPVVSAMLVGSAAGSGLSADAIRVSASMLAGTALPPEGPRWDEAALAARAAQQSADAGEPTDLVAVARLCDAAYGVHDEELLSWWSARLPHRGEINRPQ